jgi:hypothetical protein
VQDFEPLNVEQVCADLDTIKTQMDSTFYYVNGIYKILKEEIKVYGWRKTIQINSGIFIPYVVFIVLWVMWLVKRNKNQST